MRIRAEVVKALCDAANQAMMPVAVATHASAFEVLTAYMTGAKFALESARDMGVEPEAMRVAVGELMLACADEGSPM